MQYAALDTAHADTRPYMWPDMPPIAGDGCDSITAHFSYGECAVLPPCNTDH